MPRPSPCRCTRNNLQGEANPKCSFCGGSGVIKSEGGGRSKLKLPPAIQPTDPAIVTLIAVLRAEIAQITPRLKKLADHNKLLIAENKKLLIRDKQREVELQQAQGKTRSPQGSPKHKQPQKVTPKKKNQKAAQTNEKQNPRDTDATVTVIGAALKAVGIESQSRTAGSGMDESRTEREHDATKDSSYIRDHGQFGSSPAYDVHDDIDT